MVFIYTLENSEFEILADADWWVVDRSAIEDHYGNFNGFVRSLKDDYPGQDIYLDGELYNA